MKVVTASSGTEQASGEVKTVASKHFDLWLKLETTGSTVLA